MSSQRFLFGHFVFDAGLGTVLRDSSPLSIGHRGIAILHTLLKANGRIVTKTELIDAAWPGAVVEESNLTVQIAALRKALGRSDEDTEWIVTVPRVGYRFVPTITIEEQPRAQAISVEPTTPGRKPSIAVLPFANLSGDSGQEYFADGITEDIINALFRFRWFFVIARHSTFVFKGRAVDIKEIARELDVEYLLTGSVRKSAQQIRVSAELIDARSAHQLWSDSYQLDLGDHFTVQEQIAEQVAGAIEPELLKTESVIAAKRRHAGDANARDLVYQGTWFFHQITRPTHLRARELFRKARDLDTDLPEGSRGSPADWSRMDGATTSRTICAKAVTPRYVPCGSMRRTRMPTTASPKPACTRSGSMTPCALRKERSSSVRASRLDTWCSGWQRFFPARQRRRSNP